MGIRSGGPYLYINTSSGSVTLPRPDGTGSRIVRPGEAFYGPAYYDRFVQAGVLTRIYAEIATVTIPVYPQDLTPAGTAAVTVNGSYVLPPYRYQRGLDEAIAVTPLADEIVTNSCVGQPKIRLSFPLNATSEDAVHATYFFYTSSIMPKTPTFVVERTQLLGSNWRPPVWGTLPSDFYDLSPQEQVSKLMETA